MSLNLDPVGEYLSQYYSNFGRPAKNQAQILRSFLLFVMLFNRIDAKLSLTVWVKNVLPNNPVLFALIGCPCLDSAHDNLPTYRLIEHWEVNALIDLNKRRGAIDGLPEGISLDQDGRPLCKAGFRMCSWGYDKNTGHKFRCPLACGRVTECTYASECSKSTYERTIYMHNDSDMRFHPRIPRGSEQYQSIYKERTALKGPITVF